MQFGGMTDPAAANLSLVDVEFVYNTNIPGATTFIQKIQDFGIFDTQNGTYQAIRTLPIMPIHCHQ